jgi:hypothetical protein
VTETLHPYVVFLPSDQKLRILSAIFGSKAAVDILKFSLRQGISSKIYQKNLIRKLAYSNKTVIENLKALTTFRCWRMVCTSACRGRGLDGKRKGGYTAKSLQSLHKMGKRTLMETAHRQENLGKSLYGRNEEGAA